MDQEHLYIVAYDISDAKRWRRVFKIMNGYGEWLQLSIFQCRLNRARHAELVAMLDEIIHHTHDHLVLIDVGRAESVDPKVISLGKKQGGFVLPPFPCKSRELTLGAGQTRSNPV